MDSEFARIQGTPLFRVHENDRKPHHLRVLREAEQSGKTGVPFLAHDKEWVVTRLEVANGVLIIDGIEFDQFIAQYGVPPQLTA